MVRPWLVELFALIGQTGYMPLVSVSNKSQFTVQ